MTTPDLLERMAEALRTADKCMTYFGSEPERCDDEEAAAWLQIREALAAYDARGAQEEVALTDEQIIEVRDECLPNQGERFDCLAFARAILARAALKEAE